MRIIQAERGQLGEYKQMTKEDIDILKQALCPHDEDYDEPCISPHNLEIVLEQLLLESVSK